MKYQNNIANLAQNILAGSTVKRVTRISNIDKGDSLELEIYKEHRDTKSIESAVIEIFSEGTGVLSYLVSNHIIQNS